MLGKQMKGPCKHPPTGWSETHDLASNNSDPEPEAGQCGVWGEAGAIGHILAGGPWYMALLGLSIQLVTDDITRLPKHLMVLWSYVFIIPEFQKNRISPKFLLQGRLVYLQGRLVFLWDRLVVIRAKVVARKEVDSGNDIYGNPIKRIQYDIKQIKMFKGPDHDMETVFTAPSSAVCGVSLDTSGKKEYLISGGNADVRSCAQGETRVGKSEALCQRLLSTHVFWAMRLQTVKADAPGSCLPAGGAELHKRRPKLQCGEGDSRAETPSFPSTPAELIVKAVWDSVITPALCLPLTSCAVAVHGLRREQER
ncbi:hypothetical protein JZ751_007484 [Albula glossodonta]|uniref:Uncharacterized protein n=1 Tax=Albula glossodonta TaxID=121402 RepID=A0A8T2N9R5_9TELE|nr:hypothetical protein JZ751_007484 [Albula glossodonta]